MNLARFSKLDLPIYLEDHVAWTTSEIKAAAQSGRPDFVRRACLEFGGHTEDLNTALRLADLVLDTVCDYMHVEQIGHSWGLAPLSPATRALIGANYHRAHPLLPEGYALVARVENVLGAQAVTPYSYWDERIKNWNPAGVSVTWDNGVRYSNYDLRTEQFVIRRDADAEDWDVGSAVIVDIEPRLESHYPAR